MQLVILAAGLSRRYGRPKQLEPIIDEKTIIDYNIENANKCKIKNIIIITNPQIYKEMKEKYKSKARVFKSEASFLKTPTQIGNLYTLYTSLNKIKKDFIVINADDYYEEITFKKAVEFLKNEREQIGIMTYKLKNVLTDKREVNRGIIENKSDEVVSIKETIGIKIENNIIMDFKGSILDKESLVSMGFYIFRKKIKKDIKNYIKKFIKNKTYEKKEAYLTDFVSDIAKNNKIKLIKSDAKWVGLTFPEDKQQVENFLKSKCA